MLHFSVQPRVLHFKRPAGTSRGVYTERKVWYVVVSDSDGRQVGVGECAPLVDLSCDYSPADYDDRVRHFAHVVELAQGLLPYDDLRPFPSILMGLESAMMQVNRGGSVRLSNSRFARGERGVLINGLIWMGSFEEMKERIEEKLELGFKCIKLKIGAIDFENELALLRMIRKQFGPEVVELRVDANGAFSPSDAPDKLNRLAELSLHSIEQPIRAGQWQQMASLCKMSPLPIALDEELIGVNDLERKVELLDTICPQYIILKPSLHGGFRGSEEWIRLADERGIRWWVTSALESNVGLNAIAHWCADLQERGVADINFPQGLGTGQLFTDNVDYPLFIKGDSLWMNN